MRTMSRFAAIVAATGALVVVPHASAQTLHGLANADGSVTCEYGNINGTYINCVSPGARANRTDCTPPNQLVPRFQYHRGSSFAGCYNQGLVPTSFDHLGPGQVRQIGEVLVVSDMEGGLHFASTNGYKGYIGKKGVSGSEGVGQISSRAF